MFLLSQADLAHDGVIALRETRWSRSAEGLTLDKLQRDLDELHAARFIVLDRDEQELLVRSFIRRDKVYRQPNVLRAAADHLSLVSSAVIRHALAVELSRIVELDDFKPDSASVLAEMCAALPEPTLPVQNPSGNPSGNPSAEANPEGSQLRPGVRGMVKAVTTGFPVLLTPESESQPPSLREGGSGGGVTRKRAAVDGTRLPADFTVTPEMVAWAREHTPLVGGKETDAFVDYWHAVPGSKGKKLDWLATWRNWMRREQKEAERRPARASSPNGIRESTTDQRVNAALALSAKFEAMETPEIE